MVLDTPEDDVLETHLGWGGYKWRLYLGKERKSEADVNRVPARLDEAT